MARQYKPGTRLSIKRGNRVISVVVKTVKQKKDRPAPTAYAKFVQDNFHKVYCSKGNDFAATTKALARMWKQNNR
jgi:hypothetical protein